MSALFLIATFLIAAAIGGVVYWVKRSRGGEGQLPVVEPMRAPHAPFGFFFDSAHSWVRLMSDGTLRVGIDEFVTESFGRFDGVELPEPGTRIERGDTLATLRFGENRVALPSPVSGEVASRNSSALQSPITMSADPYGLGWLVALRTQDHKEALKPLHVGNGAMTFLQHELSRLGDFFSMCAAKDATPVMADGGVPQRGALGQLDRAAVTAFAETFLAQN